MDAKEDNMICIDVRISKDSHKEQTNLANKIIIPKNGF